MKMESPILGILGGGQLGRMSALAAARLGIRTHIYCPEKDCPASFVTNLFTCAAYEDEISLENFARSVDVISYEFENIPLESLLFLKNIKPVYPDEKLLAMSQNRLTEKKFLNDLGILTADWAAAYKADDIDTTLAHWKASKCIIKTARFGYDGKGQLKHEIESDSLDSWLKLDTQEAVIERIVDFSYEASIIVARDHFGKCETFPLTRNDHKNHILSESHVPSLAEKHIERQAKETVIAIAEAVDLIGVLALELFITQDGKLIANEIAPRTHNSGHWTMDGCSVSQFEQHVRAVCGLPVLTPVRYNDVTMINLIGDDVEKLAQYDKTPGACVHLYGKMETREGRKMGHVNLLKPLGKI